MNYNDAHVVDQDEAGPDDACWATVDLGDCGHPATSDVGLCDRHLEELTAGNSPAAKAWTDEPDDPFGGITLDEAAAAFAWIFDRFRELAPAVGRAIDGIVAEVLSTVSEEDLEAMRTQAIRIGRDQERQTHGEDPWRITTVEDDGFRTILRITDELHDG